MRNQDRLHFVGMKMDPKWEENVFTNKVFILEKVKGKKKREKKQKKKALNLDGGVEAFSPLCSLPRVLLGRLVKLPHAEFSVCPCYSSFFRMTGCCSQGQGRSKPAVCIINDHLFISVIQSFTAASWSRSCFSFFAIAIIKTKKKHLG